MDYNIKKTKSYEVKLTVTLNKVDLGHYISEAQKYLSNSLKIDGFRRGKAPIDITKDKLDQKQILETAFDFAFKESFADILLKEKIELLDAANFEMKENSPEKMIYTISLTVYPEFKLPAYKKISVKKKEISVSEKEVDQVIDSIRNSRTKDGKIPELTDEFAKNLGHFNSIEDLKKNVTEGLKQEKELKESQRIQAFILNSIAEKTKIEIPPALITKQLDEMILDLVHTLNQRGMELGPYLAKIKKTQDELREEWKPKAEEAVRKSLVLRKITKLENIKIDTQEVEEKISQLLMSLPNPKEVEKKIDLQKLVEEVRRAMLNEKTLKFLESQATH